MEITTQYALALMVFIAIAAMPYRPGLIGAVALLTYIYESLFASQVLGNILIFLVLGVPAFYALITRLPLVFTRYDAIFSIMIGLYSASYFYSESSHEAEIIISRLIVFSFGYFLLGKILLSIAARHCAVHRFYRDITLYLSIATILFSIVGIGNAHDRLTVGEASAVGFSGAIMASVALLLAMLVSRSSEGLACGLAWRSSFAVLLLAVLVVLYLNGTRGVLVAGFGVMGMLAVLVLTRHSMLASLVTTFVFVAAGLGTILVGSDLSIAMASIPHDERMLGWISDIRYFWSNPEYLMQASLAERRLLWGTAWHMFLEAPVFGHGMGAFRVDGVPGMYPHNLPLELLAETGLVGFAGILFGSGYFIVAVFRRLLIVGMKPELLVPMLLASGFLMQMTVSGTLWMAKPVFLSFGMLSVSLVAHEMLAHRNRTGAVPATARVIQRS